jgi:hypothetical protein
MTTSDDKPINEQPCTPGEEYVVPGTSDVACGDDADLQHCVHCGASLSANTEFCQVCSTAVSGGDLPHDHAHEADAK